MGWVGFGQWMGVVEEVCSLSLWIVWRTTYAASRSRIGISTPQRGRPTSLSFHPSLLLLIFFFLSPFHAFQGVLYTSFPHFPEFPHPFTCIYAWHIKKVVEQQYIYIYIYIHRHSIFESPTTARYLAIQLPSIHLIHLPSSPQNVKQSEKKTKRVNK